MIISNNKVVSLSYELKINGEIVDNAVEQHPLEFIYGRGQLLPLFEQNINGLKIGDTFEFMVPCEEGYGKVNEMAVVELPKEIFKVDGEIPTDLLEVGRSLPMRDNEGNALNGMIIDIKDDVIVMDFNHPLAGQDLYFNGKIEAIRDATAEELDHGHIHGNHHHHDNEESCCENDEDCCDTEEKKASHGCGCGCN
jgi:FKBP-type peptidyl-prolyl cis-trans isomerase SlyD